MPRRALDVAEREALIRLLEAPTLEVLPLRGLEPQLPAIPPGSRMTVTASPAKGLEASLELGARLAAAGHEVVIHLAARMVADRSHLRRLLAAMAADGLDRAFVIGGDARHPGAFPDAMSLLRELAEVGHHLVEIGIAGYPQGHPSILDERLHAALVEKAAHANYVTTQLCFDVEALGAWIRARRQQGIELPLVIGIPGAIEVAHLLRVSARIGVTDAGRFVSRHLGLVRRFLAPGGYRPDRLLEELAPLLTEPAAGVRGLHVYTFNQVERTEAWRRARLASLRGAG